MRKLISLILGCSFSISVYAADFTLTSSGFLDEGALPVLYTCDGKDLSPQMTWSNLPGKTQSLVLVLTDPDAPGGTWYHWSVYNIPRDTKELAQGITQLPAGASVGKNSWNKMQYNGPCPPKGTAHTYVFTLYALDTKLKLPQGADAKTLMMQLKDHVLLQTKLTAVYSRWNV